MKTSFFLVSAETMALAGINLLEISSFEEAI